MTKESSSTSQTDKLEQALAGIGKEFRSRLIKTYIDLRAAYATGQYDAAGLRAGVFAEALARLLEQELTGTHTPFGTPLANFADLCRSFERLDKARGVESLRIIIPRGLLFIYTLRNKRGIGHIGGDIEANQIDAATCVRTADWCICELIRIYHKFSLEEAQELLDAIAVRQTPTVWSVAGKRRVLTLGLPYASQVLLLLYGSDDSTVLSEDLASWIEHPRPSDFRSKVLSSMHSRRMIEWDRESDTVIISPIGIKYVEETVLRSR
jgi:hypothetical protein